MLWKRSLNFTLIVPKSFIMQATTAGRVCCWTPNRKKTAFLRKKVVIPFPSVLRLELDGRKITRDTSEQPQMFYKRKNEPRVNSTWSEHFENFNPAGSSLSSATNKTRVQIQLQQPNESFSTLIHSDENLKKAAEAGIRETYTHSSHEMREPEAFFPVPKTRC